MGVVTKTGDKGDTARFGGGRVSKNDPSVAANGDVDELVSAVGLLAARPDIGALLLADLSAVQSACFTIGSELATPEDAPAEALAYIPRVQEADVLFLEERINAMEPQLPKQTRFLLPSGVPPAAMAYWIRTIARRAERSAVAAAAGRELNGEVTRYLNRLSDYFYILARFLNYKAGAEEREWAGGSGPLPPKV
ncbi:MAG: cob(I)yrinic acid a,c-diamide adenosyltransferase [bacterium]|nr:cob(I)yrinic acid a,c-diamide adenosyltransferase [bacterium]